MENNCGNPYTNQIFQEAVERSDFAIVKTLLKYGVYLRRNQRNRNRLTALQQSVLDGNGRMAILLLENGADIEAKTSNGWTCLHIAAALGDLDILTTLINHCACLLAITKNEELPIDLAATREIKIKLAKEMSRVGYSELAQWYMKKLAAREGVFYVLSANTLLDMACDDNYDKSYSSGPPCYVRPDDGPDEVFLHEQTKQGSFWQVQDAQGIQFSADAPGADIWMEQASNENPTYLSYSSGYISEVVFDPNSGEYSKVRRSVSMSSGSSPRLKYPELVVSESKTSLSTVVTPEEEDKVDNTSRYGSLVRSSRRTSHAKSVERSNTIELLIDYSHFEDCDDPEEDAEDVAALETNAFNINAPPGILDEIEENSPPPPLRDDKHSPSEMMQNISSESVKSSDVQYKSQLGDGYHPTSVVSSASKSSEIQYEVDMYDSYLGGSIGTSLGSTIGNDNRTSLGSALGNETRSSAIGNENRTSLSSSVGNENRASLSSALGNENRTSPRSTLGSENRTSLSLTIGNENQYKNDISDSTQVTSLPTSISSTRSSDNQYKNEICESYHGAAVGPVLSSSFESQDTSASLNTRYRRFDTPDVGSYEIKPRNVRFDASDAANEFCNCPNCKKLGYAFSPDIRSTGRRVMHFGGEQVVLSPNQVMMSELQLQKTFEMMQNRGYPPNQRLYHDEAGDKSYCYTQGHTHKPRKRKKKLFSGIRSIFKDSIKVQRGGMENSPVVDDAGILFAFSLRDRSKTKEIKNRYDVRRSNSFSGCTSPHGPPHGPPDMVNTFTHDQVVPPPMKFSDTYGDADPRKKGGGGGGGGGYYLEHFQQGAASCDSSVVGEEPLQFKPTYSDSTDVSSHMSDVSDESTHLSHHMSSYNNPLFENETVIEEHTCECHTCECDNQSNANDANINNMMSKINVSDDMEKFDESKFSSVDVKKCGKTKETFVGKS